MKLLLVEDEPLLVENLESRFKRLGYIVDSALDGEQGLYLALEHDYDLIILDLGLPKLPGLVVLEKIRQAQKTLPILVLTARNSWQERVEGLKKGADDYLGKPFHFEELHARIESLAKRHQPKDSTICFHPTHLAGLQSVCLDTEAKSLQINETVQLLTATEFHLLVPLFSHPKQIFSKHALLEKISDSTQEKDENLIEVYIRRLRGYLGKESIQTLRGQGYRLTLSDTVEVNK
ncbi:DNA-binding response regulator [Thiomicrorhabdus immobilis]|uniref:DNA-binding response regulator n=1 Tax=Thiomicrorhabdus immobilis TaxID=2791037 RepID=A0ABN6CUF3_9GAMM|nr:response regulator transcription factor [Thiomicrorhabdus immobilis]BCN92523.1 DNA-binding response regulator [Thiomicrorhabdus immobilis]